MQLFILGKAPLCLTHIITAAFVNSPFDPHKVIGSIYCCCDWLYNRFPVTQGTLNNSVTDTERNCHSKSGSTTDSINKPLSFLNMRDNGKRHSQFYKYSSIGDYKVSKQHETKYSRNNINIDDSDKDIK